MAHWRPSLLLVAALILMANGCIAIPIPVEKHYANWPPGRIERPWESLKPDT